MLLDQTLFSFTRVEAARSSPSLQAQHSRQLKMIINFEHRRQEMLSGTTILIACASLFFLIRLFLFTNSRRRSENIRKHGHLLPLPSPPKLPLIGNLHQLGRYPHRSLAALSQKHGPLMLLHYGSIPVIVVSSKKMAEEITKNHDHVFASRPRLVAPDRLLYGCADVAFSPYGSYWRQAKKICILQLLSLKKVQSFRFIREEEVALLLDSLSSSCAQGSVVDLTDKFFCLTESFICRAALGKTFSEREGNSKFHDILIEFGILMGKVYMEDFFPHLWWVDVLRGLRGRVERNFRMIAAFLDEVIEEHVRSTEEAGAGDGERKDFVDVLLQVQKEEELDIPLTKNHIKGLILDMFVAGTATVGTALDWTMAELVRHPAKMRRAQAEVRGLAIAKGKGNTCLVLDEDVQKNLKYLNCVIKESLRLHPPIPLLVPRKLTQDTIVQGHFVPGGTMTMINAWAIGRDAKSWENAGEFWPERFMTNELDVRGLDFELIPFGAGRRICPGISFAMYAIGFVLANLLYHFDWKVPDGGNPEELDMSEGDYGVNQDRRCPLRLIPTAPSVP